MTSPSSIIKNRVIKYAGNARSRRSRFWKKVKKTPGCWLWTGAVNEHGYGVFDHGKAYRIAWELEIGPIPEGMNVLHRCDNPPCVKPSHLWTGTDLQNRLDMIGKGRAYNPAGIEHWNHLLSESDVKHIRRLKEQGLSYGKIRKVYPKVSKGCLQKVVERRTWKHIT